MVFILCFVSLLKKHIMPTSYAIGTNYSPAELLTSIDFVKSASIYLQVHHMDRLSQTTPRSTIKSTFIHFP